MARLHNDLFAICARRGMTVSVVHLGRWLLDRQLDETAGRMLQRALEARGLNFLLGSP